LVGEVGLREAARQSVQSAAAGARKVAAVDGFLDSIAAYVQREKNASLDGLLKRLALDAREDDTAPDGSYVSLMSLHAAKGLEWPYVFLCGMEEELLPHSGMQGELPNLPEERRLAYVGITRARERLYLTRAAQRVRRGKPMPKAASRFLDDIPSGLLEVVDHTAIPAGPAGEAERSFFSALRSRLKARP
jgi:DNA helicase-2/ATP-dependent DNA helicase PcrA